MLPLYDDNPTIRPPIAVYSLIFLNVVFFIFVEETAEYYFSARHLELDSIYRLLTHIFMHADWVHLLGNMLFLWIFGNNVEDAMGSLRFVWFYLLCGLASSIPELSIHPTIPSLGASGAISGVTAAYFVLYPKARIYFPLFLLVRVFLLRVPAYLMIGFYFVLDAQGYLFALSERSEDYAVEGGLIGYGAHAIGFLFGLVAIIFFKNPNLVAQHPYVGWVNEQPPPRPLPEGLSGPVKLVNNLLAAVLVLVLVFYLDDLGFADAFLDGFFSQMKF